MIIIMSIFIRPGLNKTPRQPKGNKIRGFKVKTSTQKLKSQYVNSAKKSKNQSTNVPGMSQKNFRKISHPKMDIFLYLSNFSKELTNAQTDRVK